LIVPNRPEGHEKIEKIILKSGALILRIGIVVKASELLGIYP